MSISGAMLTSLNVVKMALVDCDCKRRSAIRARRRLIGTRCSGRSPRSAAFAGLATCGNKVAGAVVGMGLAAAILGATGAEAAASTSPLITRPSFPVPATEPAAMLLSAISLAAAGMAMPAIEPPETAAGAAAAAGAGAAATEATTGATAAPAFPSVSMRAMTCSAATVAPSATTSSTSTPADGAGTSSTTLSVSISINISSTAMASPIFFFHCSMVASATDSDNWGTLTSTMAMMILFCIF